jgi:uncharacterized membrane protein
MNQNGPSDRPVDLSQAPSSMTPPSAAPPPPQGSAPSGSNATSGSFDFNQPTIISLLYISSFLLGVTALVAVVLAYVWKDQAHAEWEVSHYRYHIRTFWIALIGSVVSIILMIVLIGFLLWLAVAVLVVVRSVLSLINAQKQQPMPNPDTWLA